jgi:hypothetical protein
LNKDEELRKQWDNGNRKYVVREMSRMSRDEIFTFLLLFSTSPSHRTTLMMLALQYKDTWE